MLHAFPFSIATIQKYIYRTLLIISQPKLLKRRTVIRFIASAHFITFLILIRNNLMDEIYTCFT